MHAYPGQMMGRRQDWYQESGTNTLASYLVNIRYPYIVIYFIYRVPYYLKALEL